MAYLTFKGAAPWRCTPGVTEHRVREGRRQPADEEEDDDDDSDPVEAEDARPGQHFLADFRRLGFAAAACASASPRRGDI